MPFWRNLKVAIMSEERIVKELRRRFQLIRDRWSQIKDTARRKQLQSLPLAVHEGAFYQVFVGLSTATSFELISENIDVPLGQH